MNFFEGYLLFLILQIKKEYFIDANFKLCEKNDCGCLKMNTAQMELVLNTKFLIFFLIPGYENKKVYQSYVEIIYILKERDNIILIFVGVKMKNVKIMTIYLKC